MNIKDPYFIENAFHSKMLRERKKFDGTDEEFEKNINKKIKDKLPTVFSNLRKVMVKHAFALAKHTAKYDRSISKQILSGYNDTLDFLDPFLEYNVWIGQTFYEKYRKVFNTYNDHLKVDTLTEIHCRACQIAAEIKVLVKNGYADGAMARWRSLHELCTIFLFLYDNDMEVLHMYLDYEVIESYKKMNKYDDDAPKIGQRKISIKVRKDIENQRTQLIQKYGNEFKDEYGWTMKVLPKGNRHFKGIEVSVQQDHLRAVYSWASENVHAGVSGNKKRLGLSSKNAKKFLRGSSPDGIFDPVRYTAYTLAEMSSTLLGMEDSILNKMYDELLFQIQEMLMVHLRNEDKTFLRKQRVKRTRKAALAI